MLTSLKIHPKDFESVWDQIRDFCLEGVSQRLDDQVANLVEEHLCVQVAGEVENQIKAALKGE